MTEEEPKEKKKRRRPLPIDEIIKIVEEHKDCRHKYCNLSKKDLPCWKVIREDIRGR